MLTRSPCRPCFWAFHPSQQVASSSRTPLLCRRCVQTSARRRPANPETESRKPVRTSVLLSELPRSAIGPDGEVLTSLDPFVSIAKTPKARRRKQILQESPQADISPSSSVTQDAVSPAGEAATGNPPIEDPTTEAPKRRRKKKKAVDSSPNEDLSADAGTTPPAPEHLDVDIAGSEEANLRRDTNDEESESIPEVSLEDHPRLKELGPDGKEWPRLAKDVLTNMGRFPGCVLLTRVGGFYESYFEQAPLLSGVLSIKLANRTWSGRSVPMAGFPISQLEKYLKVLVEDNKKLVAICEEFRTDEEGAETPSPADWKAITTTRLLNEKIEITRRVTRVVSPGTLIDEKWMNPMRHNFIMSISPSESADAGFGVAWLDLSTSDFHVSQCSDGISLRDEVKRIAPSEVVLRPSADGEIDVFRRDGDLWESLELQQTLVSYSTSDEDLDISGPWSEFESGVVDQYSMAEQSAVKSLTSHLRNRLIDLSRKEHDGTEMDFETLLTSGLIQRHVPEKSMAIDANTLDALEVRETMREGGIRGSLVSTVRKTQTKGGARLLVEWLTAPSTDLVVINERHAIVDFFVKQRFFFEDIRLMFRAIQRGDLPRTLQRITAARNDEQDLLEIRDFTKFVADIKAALSQYHATSVDRNDGQEAEGLVLLEKLSDSLIDVSDLGATLGNAIDERVMEKRLRAMEAMDRDEADEDEDNLIATTTASSTTSGTDPLAPSKKKDDDAWAPVFEHLIRPSSSKQLFLLTREYETLREDANALQQALREQFGSHGKLTLRFLLGQGFVVHISDYKTPAVQSSTDTAAETALEDASKEDGETVQPQKSPRKPEDHMNIAYRTKSTRSFYFDKWSQMGSRMVRLQEELKRAESMELRRLRALVISRSAELRANARRIDELDCLLGFAQLAQELRLVRPTMTSEPGIFDVVEGRHIGVELGLLERGKPFTSNSLHLSPTSRVHFITGPNMGGKSTFLRQNALISILAQAGSFIPADAAKLSIVDRLFSRVGARDDLFRDRSTFMVEMLETSEILRRATRHSLVIADEIGRGTTVNVGIAIAYATVERLGRIGCRALFASHLHELADMMGYDESSIKVVEAQEAARYAESSDDAEGNLVEHPPRPYPCRGGPGFEHVEFWQTDVMLPSTPSSPHIDRGGTTGDRSTPDPSSTEIHSTDSGTTMTDADSIVYLHTLKPGINRESHGLTVAALAGMPQDALAVARTTLKALEDRQRPG